MKSIPIILASMFMAGCAMFAPSPAERLARAKRLLADADYASARVVLQNLTQDESGSPEMIAESLYWTAEAYAAEGNLTNAYRTAKRLVWDHPETKWAGRYMGKLPIWKETEETQPVAAPLPSEAAASEGR